MVQRKKNSESNVVTIEDSQPKAPRTETSSANNKIALDELIPVVSLIDYPLNLLQQPNGRNARYRFDEFGQKKEILYQDFLLILENYMSFLQEGVFYVLDQRVINRHGLQDIQGKVLTKEKIEKIITNSKDAFQIYKQAPEKQQKNIVGMIKRKLTEDAQAVDMNLVDKIARYSKINILKDVEEMRENFSKPKAG